MDKTKGKRFSFIIPQPVNEVKSRLLTYTEHKKFGFRGLDYLTVVRTTAIELGASWNIEIKRVPFGNMIPVPRKIRFLGTIRYQDLENTFFEGQFVVNNHFYKYVIGIILIWLAVEFSLAFLVVGSTAFCMRFAQLAILLNAFVQWSIELATYTNNRNKIMAIIRDLAPDDVIL